MAESNAHKFGQIIGNLIEEIVEPVLTKFSRPRGYYLDKKGKRGKARRGKKVTWNTNMTIHTIWTMSSKKGELPMRLGGRSLSSK